MTYQDLSSFKSIVVGGGGFIGVHLVEKLISSGRQNILVIGRNAKRPQALSSIAEYRPINPLDPFFFDKAFDECSEVIDLAYRTVPTTSFDDPVKDILGNLPFAVNLLKIAVARKVLKYVVISSGGTVYGNAQHLPIQENHPTNPISPYGITKLAVEKYALMYHESAGLPVIIIRPSNPYGPNQYGDRGQGFIATAIFRMLRNEEVLIFGDRGNSRDYIFIDDLTEGIVAALNHGVFGEIYNCGTGIGMDNQDILQEILSLITPKLTTVKIVLKAARPFDVDANILNYQKLANVSRWKPKVDLKEGLSRTVHWVRAQARKDVYQQVDPEL